VGVEGGGRGIKPGEHAARFQKGGALGVLQGTRTFVLQDPDGAVLGAVETFRDLSAIEQLRRELEHQYTFEDIVGSVMTCEFDLHLPSPSVDPTLVNFYFDGIDVPGNSTDGVCYNGWGWLNPEHTRIRFCGSYCNSIMSHTVTEITATWGCPTITP